MIVQEFDDLEAMSHAAVRLCVEKFADATGSVSIALSGGKTPGRAYELLSQSKLDWRRIQIFRVDERYVPPDHPDSNEGLARRALISRIPVPAVNVHPIYLDGGPDEAASVYDELMARVNLDFCFMGLGSDGHTASLFPGDDASLRSAAFAVHTHSPAGIPERISLTPTAFNRAKTLVFLVSGADKIIPLQRLMAGEPLPSKVVADSAEEAIFLVDRAAAGG